MENQSQMVGLGIMSGSSLDGIDLALVVITESSFKMVEKESIAFPDRLSKSLRQSSTMNVKDYLLLEAEFTKFCADAITNNIKTPFDFIAVHGHTTHHLPEKYVSNQMVNGGLLSGLTKKRVVTDFRVGDIALGGTGTPMVPIVEKHLFTGYDYYLNLGGIANITMADGWKAYDVCPCNQLLNFVANGVGMDYDKNGDLARRGKMDHDLMSLLGSFEFYGRKPPKAIDNNWIKDNYIPLLQKNQKHEDVLHTLVQWIAEVIIDQIDKGGKLFVTGGGAHNGFLIGCIRERTERKGIEVIVPAKEIIDYKEAILMAYLGYLRLHNKPTMMSTVTGARKDSIGGAIYDVYGK